MDDPFDPYQDNGSLAYYTAMYRATKLKQRPKKMKKQQRKQGDEVMSQWLRKATGKRKRGEIVESKARPGFEFRKRKQPLKRLLGGKEGRDSAQDLCAGVYRVEFPKSKYVWHGTTWSVAQVHEEVASMLQSGLHPHLGMQHCFDHGERDYRVEIVLRLGMFPEKGKTPLKNNNKLIIADERRDQLKGEALNVERTLDKKLNKLQTRFIKSCVRVVLKQWRRTRLLPAFEKFRAFMEQSLQEEQDAATIEIQRVVRGHLRRNEMRRLRKSRAQIVLAKYARQRQAIRRVASERIVRMQTECARKMQGLYRRKRARKMLFAALERRQQDDASYTIQHAWRGYISRRICRAILDARKQNKASFKICAFIRMCISKEKLWHLRMERAAIRVQTRWRCHRGQLHVQLLRAHQREQELAATEIQKRIRIRAARKKFLEEKRKSLERAAIKIQARWRAKHCQTAMFLIKRERDRCAMVIQRFFRANAVKIYIRNRRKAYAARLFQRKFRRIQRKKARAARKIQRFRKHIIRSRHARAIQAIWRGALARNLLKRSKSAASVIQRTFRSHQSRAMLVALRERKERLKGMPLCDECNDEVCSVLCNACEGKFCGSCMRIIHMILKDHEKMHLRSKQGVIFHVHWTREDVNAAMVVQRSWRSRNARILLLTKKAKRIKQEHALMMARMRWKLKVKHTQKAKILQRFARGFLVRKRIETQHKNACKIQARYRAHVARKNYRAQRDACIKIQTMLRTTKVRSDYDQFRRAIIKLQSLARQRKDLKQYKHVRVKAILLQNQIRMHQQYVRFAWQKWACKTIQRYARGYIDRKKLARKHQAAACIQAQVRCHLTREEFLAKKRLCVQLQTNVRAFQARKAMENRRIAFVRAMVLEERGLERSARIIQRRWREWFKVKQATLRIQRAWRRRQGQYAAFLVRAARRNVVSGENELECAWTKQWDSYNERTYYFNQETLETSWDKPQAYVDAENELCERKHMDNEEYLVRLVMDHEKELEFERQKYDAENWQVHVDLSSGYKYYQNDLVGVTTWDRPEVLGPDPDIPIWETIIHPVLNRPYYHHRETGEVTWDRPVDVLGYEFTEYWDFDKKVPYWHSNVTGDVTYVKPDEITKEETYFKLNSPKHQLQLEVVSEDRVAALDDDRYRDWHEAIDEKSGKTYYFCYNTYTQTTEEIQWDKPMALMKECEKWDEYYSFEDQCSYYVNKFTKESTWKKPY